MQNKLCNLPQVAIIVYHNNWWLKKKNHFRGAITCHRIAFTCSWLLVYYTLSRNIFRLEELTALSDYVRSHLDTVAQNMFCNLPQVAIIVYPNNWRLKHTTLEGGISFHGIVFTCSWLFGHCDAKHVSQPPPGCNYSIPQQLTTKKTHNTWGGDNVSWHCFYS